MRIVRFTKWTVSAALLAVGIAACGAESDDTAEGGTSSDESALDQSLDPNADDSTAASFCNGCYISTTACQQQVAPGSGCTCARSTCGCSGAAPIGMTCP